jgi:hypothetical protein
VVVDQRLAHPQRIEAEVPVELLVLDGDEGCGHVGGQGVQVAGGASWLPRTAIIPPLRSR